MMHVKHKCALSDQLYQKLNLDVEMIFFMGVHVMVVFRVADG